MKKILYVPIICVIFAACNAGSGNMAASSSDYSENSQSQSQPSDWQITANVKKELMGDSSLSSSARMISVSTTNGVVTLSGTAASKSERRKIVSMVENMDGVQSVDNQISVSK